MGAPTALVMFKDARLFWQRTVDGSGQCDFSCLRVDRRPYIAAVYSAIHLTHRLSPLTETITAIGSSTTGFSSLNLPTSRFRHFTRPRRRDVVTDESLTGTYLHDDQPSWVGSWMPMATATLSTHRAKLRIIRFTAFILPFDVSHPLRRRHTKR